MQAKANEYVVKINNAKVKHLIAAELMTQAGLESIEIAKGNGSWEILDHVEELIIPKIWIKHLTLMPVQKTFSKRK